MLHAPRLSCASRMLPGLNAAAVGLIVGSVVLLTLQIHATSPFSSATMCIGRRAGLPLLTIVPFCCGSVCQAPQHRRTDLQSLSYSCLAVVASWYIVHALKARTWHEGACAVLPRPCGVNLYLMAVYLPIRMLLQE